jgi:hypothetical protein
VAAMPGLVFEPKVAKSVVAFMAADSPDKVGGWVGGCTHAQQHACAHAQSHMHVNPHAPTHVRVPTCTRMYPPTARMKHVGALARDVNNGCSGSLCGIAGREKASACRDAPTPHTLHPS